MMLQGHVKNGVIVPDEPVVLPEGAVVHIEVAPQSPPNNLSRADEATTLYQRLKPFVGSLDGLPADASVNLDHYLYGTPKQT